MPGDSSQKVDAPVALTDLVGSRLMEAFRI